MLQKVIISGSALFINLVIVGEIFGWFESFSSDSRESITASSLYLILFLTIVIMMVGLTANSKIAFDFWWKFSRFALPISILAVISIGFGVLHTDTGGGYGWSGYFDPMFDALSLGLFFLVFIAGSLLQVFRGYRAEKLAANKDKFSYVRPL